MSVIKRELTQAEKDEKYKQALTFSNEKELVECLVLAGCNVREIARAIKRSTRYLKRNYVDTIKTTRSIIHAAVARSIIREALTGSAADRIFYAKSQMGWRETQNVDVQGGLTLALNINVAGTDLKEVNIVDVTPKTPTKKLVDKK